eukprot:3867928-Rhodomonas_salina.3
MDQRWDDRDLEQGWCSHCVRRTEHKLKEKTWLPGLWRSIYECKGCKKRTVPCINDCGAAAKGREENIESPLYALRTITTLS